MARQPADHPRPSKHGTAGDPAGRIIDATLELAAIEGWSGLSMAQIAEAAGLTLAELHASFPSKGCLLEAFIRRVDDKPEIIKDRLAAYHAQTAPLYPFYEGQKKLSVLDGSLPIDEVTRQLFEILEPLVKARV